MTRSPSKTARPTGGGSFGQPRCWSIQTDTDAYNWAAIEGV
jgi:hypothetical protein